MKRIHRGPINLYDKSEKPDEKDVPLDRNVEKDAHGGI